MSHPPTQAIKKPMSRSEQNPDTKTRIIAASTIGFAKTGFYGTSIDSIAVAVGIKKPSLLHHFANKEKLYGAVIDVISQRLLADFNRATTGGDSEQQQMIALLESFYRWNKDCPNESRLLLREMLDNPERAAQAHNWYLAPWLDRLVALIQTGQQRGSFQPVEPLAFIYNIIGAQHYFAVSLPTLKQILSAKDFNALLKNQRQELMQLVETRLFQ